MHYTVHFFNVVKLNQPLLILVATWGMRELEHGLQSLLACQFGTEGYLECSSQCNMFMIVGCRGTENILFFFLHSYNLKSIECGF